MAPIAFNLKQIIRSVGNFTALPFVGLYSGGTTSTPATTESISIPVAFVTATSVFTPTVFEPSNDISTAITTAAPVIEETSTSIFPTVVTTSVPVDEGQAIFFDVRDAFKAKDIGTWVYVLLGVVLLVLIAVSLFVIHKCRSTGVSRTPRRVRNQSSLKELEEGRGREGIDLKGLELDNDGLRKEGNKKRDSDRYGYGSGKMVESDSERVEREQWVFIKSRLSSQSQLEYERRYKEGMLQLKVANGTLGTTLDGTSKGSPCSLTVPSRALIKNTHVSFPLELDAHNRGTTNLSPIQDIIISPEVSMYK